MSKVNQFKFLFIIAMMLSFTTNSYADPKISTLNGTVNLDQKVDLFGSNFGTKTTAAPLQFNNNDSEPLLSLPSGYTAHTTSLTGVGISSKYAHSGAQSVEFNVTNVVSGGGGGEDFPRIGMDMGSGTNVDKVYLSAWVYFELQGNNTADGFNWKGPILSSGTNYYWSSGSTLDTASGFAGFYAIGTTYYNLNKTNQWFNAAAVTQYSDGTTAQYSYGNNPSWPSDAFLFGQWQRIEWIWNSSSSPNATDGSIIVNRIGHSDSPQLIKATGLITNGPNNYRWRYVSIPQGVTNVNSGILNLKMYFDDIYVDNSLARVELCDSATWAARTHCEIQPPVAWDTEHIKINISPGTFASDQNLFLYVSDANGVVNSNGFAVTLGKTYSSMTTPKNLVGNKTVP